MLYFPNHEPYKYLIIVIVLLSAISLLEAIICSSHSDCQGSQSCCRRRNKCALDCIGEWCSYTSDCAKNERCYANICQIKPNECKKDEDCPSSNPYCCGLYECSKNCLGYECSWNTSCGSGEVCSDGICKRDEHAKDGACDDDLDCSAGSFCCERTGPDDNTCASSCILNSCNEHSDCAPDECCDRENGCAENCSGGMASWVLVLTIIMIIVVITGTVSLWLRYCRTPPTHSNQIGRVNYTSNTTQETQSPYPLPPQTNPSMPQHCPPTNPNNQPLYHPSSYHQEPPPHGQYQNPYPNEPPPQYTPTL